MNRIKILLVAILINGGLTFAQIGIQTNTPDASSALDIVSTNKGILIPRVTLTNSLANPSPVTSPATGLLVFNTGANQAVGLYYWSGSAWVYVSGGTPSGNFWSLTGNSGTTPGTNFVGTTDNVDLTFNTNSAERMRIEQDGQVVVNATASLDPADVFTVSGTSGQSGINAYGSTIGLYSDAGTYGLMSFVNNSSGMPVYGKNYNVDGTGALLVGSNLNGTVFATPFSAGSVSWGNQGVIANGKHATGNGILAAGSLSSSIIYINPGTGGTLIGYHGVYGKGLNATDGTGIIGVGNNLSSYSTLTTGSGGSFFGYHGVFGKAANNSGIGIIGLGNNLSTYSIMPVGSGGAFTGYHGVFGSATNAASGVGVIGIGNNGSTAYYATNGSGGSFAGFNGSISTAVDATGTGIIGVGNASPTIGLAPTGSGGAFTGTVCGVYGYATNSANDRYGGYFATGGALYAYVGGRYSNTNRKIVGTGTVSTIVKNVKGDLITLNCPEAPEIVFQDYGIGQLENGYAHITIDPDLAININVSENHPLKVFVTLEGDCNGIYVTNKSANGFDVIELKEGKSNVPFSWQIVATRANETYTLRDGTLETNDNSQRFQPAPGPLELEGDQSRQNSLMKVDLISTSPVEAQDHELKPVEIKTDLKKE